MSVQQASTGLSAEVMLALTYADVYRKAAGQERIHMEHLLMGLFEADSPGVRAALGPAAGSREQFIERLTATVPSFKWAPFESGAATEVTGGFSSHVAAALDGIRSLGAQATALALVHAARAVDCHVNTALFGVGDSRTNLTVVNDNSVVHDEDDRLELRTFADALAAMIDAPSTRTPVTIAISAPWGAGKTSLARMVQARLERKPAGGGYAPHVVCWFNAWLHDGAVDLSAAFAGAVARRAHACRAPWLRLLRPLPEELLTAGELRRRRLFKLGMLFAAIGVALFYLWPALVQVATAQQKEETLAAISRANPIVGAILALGLLGALFNHVSSVAKGLASFVSDPKAAAASGSMDDVREQLSRLITSSTPPGSRFIVFVDDLERCKPPRPIEVLEVINQLLSDAPVVTVLLADLSAVAASADLKYADLARQHYSPDADQQARIGSRVALPYGWMYLQKIVQLRFDVPLYTAAQMQELMTTFMPKRQADRPAPDAAAPAAPVEPAALLLLRRNAQWILQQCATPAVAASRFVEDTIYPPHRRSAASVQTYEGLRAAAPLVTGLALAGAVAYSAATVIAARTLRLPLTAIELLAAAAAGVGVSTILSAAIAVLRRREDRRRLLTARAAGGAADPAVAQIIKAEARYHEFTDESDVLKDAMETALKHLAPLPRTSKRLLNELRLMLYVGTTRGVFEDGAVQPQHFGKWAALRERWPELARLIAVRPEILTALESPRSEDQQRADLETLVESLKNDPELINFFCAQPKLGPVIDRVVRFTPSPRRATAAS